MKKILVLACSHGTGYECEDEVNHCWPKILGDIAHCDVTNAAEVGGSNDMMFRKALSMSAVESYDLVLIAWTSIDRMEVYFNDPMDTIPTELASKKYPRAQGPGPVSVSHRWSELPWIKQYYGMHFNERYQLERWLHQAVTLQEYFKAKKQAFVYVSNFGNTQYLKSHTSIPMLKMLDVKSWIGNWPGSTLQDWGKPVGVHKYGHFTLDAHQFIAEKIHEHIRNRGWLP
jgi:hypothetical protein